MGRVSAGGWRVQELCLEGAPGRRWRITLRLPPFYHYHPRASRFEKKKKKKKGGAGTLHTHRPSALPAFFTHLNAPLPAACPAYHPSPTAHPPPPSCSPPTPVPATHFACIFFHFLFATTCATTVTPAARYNSGPFSLRCRAILALPTWDHFLRQDLLPGVNAVWLNHVPTTPRAADTSPPACLPSTSSLGCACLRASYHACAYSPLPRHFHGDLTTCRCGWCILAGLPVPLQQYTPLHLLQTHIPFIWLRRITFGSTPVCHRAKKSH